jgi:ferrochelatase
VTIEDILNLTEGTLRNKPEIQAVEGATAFPSKVDQGDLFFAADNDDIAAAVANGAYAIVYQGNTEQIDPEAAWIQVDSVQKAAFRLLRYVLLKKEAEFYYMRPHEMSFLKQILTHKGNISFLPSEWNKAFEQVLNGDKYLYASTDEELLSQIKPEYKRLEEQADGYRVSDTLFRSTFRIGKYVYQDKELVPFHLPHLLRTVSFCHQHELPYSIDRVHYTKHFLPVYINSKFETVSRGASDRVLIFVDNIPDIVDARDYVRHQSTWVKSIVLTPPKTKVDNVERPHWFETPEQAMEILKQFHFNYAFIYSLDKEVLKSFQAKETGGLFSSF